MSRMKRIRIPVVIDTEARWVATGSSREDEDEALAAAADYLHSQIQRERTAQSAIFWIEAEIPVPEPRAPIVAEVVPDGC